MVCGKQFRRYIRQPIPHLRFVDAFTPSSTQRNVALIPPPKPYCFRQRPVRTTRFRKFFERGDIPAGRAFQKGGVIGVPLMWKVPTKDLDYNYFLPLFFDGLSEAKEPYRTLARCGCKEMLRDGGTKILPLVPRLILPLKNALNTRDPDIIIATIKIIQELIKAGPCIGYALVPYYRQLLPIFNIFRDKNENIGDKIDFDRVGRLGDLIWKTLQLMEKTGGKDAFINIKYMIPTYESYIDNN